MSEGNWLQELDSLTESKKGEGKTAMEIAEEVGRGVQWVRDRLNKAKREGLLIVELASRTRLNGVEGVTYTYRLKKKGTER